MDEWKGIVAAIEHLLMYEKKPQEDVEMLSKAIFTGGEIVFTAEEIIEALDHALKSKDDLSGILPMQKHSDAVLRETFASLYKLLKEGIKTKV